MESTNPHNQEFAYAPSAILSVFNNAISVTETKKIILVKGVYAQGNGTKYNGYYYDLLKDESSDATITLIVPELIRNRLSNNKTLSFWGYITRRVVAKGGRIEIQINLSELLEQTHNKYNDEEIKALELLKAKAENGYHDVTTFIKQRVITGQRITINILIGKTAIIDQDIFHQLKDTIAIYNINFIRINISSETEIINSIRLYNKDEVDILCVARGGGENIDVFDKPDIAQACIGLSPIVVTAIGHATDTTLLDKIADKSFNTPTAFGQHLNDLYNDTIEELQNSKAKLVDDITKSLKANYDKQVLNLREQLAASEKQQQQLVQELKSLNEKEKLLLHQNIKSANEQSREKDILLSSYKKQIESLQTQLSRIPAPQPVSEFNWGYAALIIIAAFIIGMATCN